MARRDIALVAHLGDGRRLGLGLELGLGLGLHLSRTLATADAEVEAILKVFHAGPDGAAR